MTADGYLARSRHSQFDFGLQFVRAGGRKASLRGVYSGWGHGMSGLAQQIAVESSSTAVAGNLSKEQRKPPTYIPIASAPREEGTRGEGAEDGREGGSETLSGQGGEASRRKFAGGCTIGAVPSSAAAATCAATSSASSFSSLASTVAPTPTVVPNLSEADAERLSAALAAKGSDVQALVQLAAAPGGRLATREKLIELGFGKMGERLRLENALMRTLASVAAA